MNLSTNLKIKVSKPQQLLAIEEALKATPTRWGATHKSSISNWHICHKLIEAQLGEVEHYKEKKYDKINYPHDHLVPCQTTWIPKPKEERVHVFDHTLDEVPQTWYAKLHGYQSQKKNVYMYLSIH